LFSRAVLEGTLEEMTFKPVLEQKLERNETALRRVRKQTDLPDIPSSAESRRK
jgi:hypothetical protein